MARKIAACAGIVVAQFLILRLLGGSGAGGSLLHLLQETLAVLLSLGVATIALLRYYSRRSNRILLLGTAFLGTAFLDAYHGLVTSFPLGHRFPAPELSTSAWSWLASRIFLSGFLLLVCLAPREEEAPGKIVSDRAVFASVALMALACFAFFTFTPLPSAYFPGFPVPRPAELLPGAVLALALAVLLRRGAWRCGGFEHWLILCLGLGILCQILLMPFSRQPFDAAYTLGHAAKNLSYLCVLFGLLSSIYQLFRQADASAAELARVNAALQGEMRERARAEQARDQFFDLSLDPLAIAGTDGYFKYLNPAWEAVLGWTLDELKSRPYIELIHPDDVEATADAARKLRLGGDVIDFENRYRTRDGSYRWLSWRSTALPEQGLVFAVARDIDERKRIERMKNDFISVVSHELRTPLTSIRGALGLVAGGVAGGLPDKARELLEIADKNSERLVRLINDILDVEKMESGTMGFHPASLELLPLVEQALESDRSYAEPYGVELRLVEAQPGLLVWADAERIQQVMANLLSNAVKFSPRGGAVEIRVTGAEGMARVSVADRGSGIPAAFQSRIFQKFAQADASSTRQKGETGLGLSICKAIVERHGGRIWFETGPGAGTTFSFELPLSSGPLGGAG